MLGSAVPLRHYRSPVCSFQHKYVVARGLSSQRASERTSLRCVVRVVLAFPFHSLPQSNQHHLCFFLRVPPGSLRDFRESLPFAPSRVLSSHLDLPTNVAVSIRTRHRIRFSVCTLLSVRRLPLHPSLAQSTANVSSRH